MMFADCAKLGEVTCLATDGFAVGTYNDPLYYWLSNAGGSASPKKIHIKSSDTHNNNDWNVPTGWTLVRDQP